MVTIYLTLYPADVYYSIGGYIPWGHWRYDMYRDMTDADLDCLAILAVKYPAALGHMTPGQLCDRFGVPCPDQESLVHDVVTFECGHFRSRTPVAVV